MRLRVRVSSSATISSYYILNSFHLDLLAFQHKISIILGALRPFKLCLGFSLAEKGKTVDAVIKKSELKGKYCFRSFITVVQQSWFPSRKAPKNYTNQSSDILQHSQNKIKQIQVIGKSTGKFITQAKLFGIKIVNKNDPLVQLDSTTDSFASLPKKQLNEIKGIKHIETSKLTFKVIYFFTLLINSSF